LSLSLEPTYVNFSTLPVVFAQARVTAGVSSPPWGWAVEWERRGSDAHRTSKKRKGRSEGEVMWKKARAKALVYTFREERTVGEGRG
jgi:hypothetical protein